MQVPRSILSPDDMTTVMKSTVDTFHSSRKRVWFSENVDHFSAPVATRSKRQRKFCQESMDVRFLESAADAQDYVGRCRDVYVDLVTQAFLRAQQLRQTDHISGSLAIKDISELSEEELERAAYSILHGVTKGYRGLECYVMMRTERVSGLRKEILRHQWSPVKLAAASMKASKIDRCWARILGIVDHLAIHNPSS